VTTAIPDLWPNDLAGPATLTPAKVKSVIRSLIAQGSEIAPEEAGASGMG
jgi:hypothetical protein